MSPKQIPNLFQLTPKRLVLVILTFFFATILHNLVSAVLGIEEAFFFTLAVILAPLYLITSTIYTFLHYRKNKLKLQ